MLNLLLQMKDMFSGIILLTESLIRGTKLKQLYQQSRINNIEIKKLIEIWAFYLIAMKLKVKSTSGCTALLAT